MNQKQVRLAVWAIVFAAFVFRIGAGLYRGEDEFWSGYQFFFDFAQSIAAGKGMAFSEGHPTAFRVPLYPVFLLVLTWGRRVFAPVLVAQALVGAGTVRCAAILAGDMFGPTAAIAAACITAVYPYYLAHDVTLQETSLYTLLTALAVILLKKVHRSGAAPTAAAAGFVLGLDVLTRATIAPFAILAPCLLAWLQARESRVRLRSALLCAAATAIVLTPWLVRSYRITGLPLLNTETGFQLMTGNNDYTFSHYPIEKIDLEMKAALEALNRGDKADLAAATNDEAALNRWYMGKGVGYIREHPWLTFSRGMRKLGVAFGPLISPRSSAIHSLTHALSYGPIALFGGWGMWLRRKYWPEDSFIYLTFLCFVLETMLFFAHTNHRAYLDVYLIVFTAGVVSSWLSRLTLMPSEEIVIAASPGNISV